jgi:hypothetical protein
VEKWYPKRIFPYLNKNQAEKFWNDYDLEPNDWFGKDSFSSVFYFSSQSFFCFSIGLTSKLLQQLFCRDFLTPLEQTDVFYSLQVGDMNLRFRIKIHCVSRLII